MKDNSQNNLPETKNLINYSTLKQMKKNAIIVNTARGGIINEIDLDKALNENLIFGAGLDVFEEEPPKGQSPFAELKQVILTPHVAGLSQEAAKAMAICSVQNVIDYFDNSLDKYLIVNKEKLFD